MVRSRTALQRCFSVPVASERRRVVGAVVGRRENLCASKAEGVQSHAFQTRASIPAFYTGAVRDDTIDIAAQRACGRDSPANHFPREIAPTSAAWLLRPVSRIRLSTPGLRVTPTPPSGLPQVRNETNKATTQEASKTASARRAVSRSSFMSGIRRRRRLLFPLRAGCLVVPDSLAATVLPGLRHKRAGRGDRAGGLHGRIGRRFGVRRTLCKPRHPPGSGLRTVGGGDRLVRAGGAPAAHGRQNAVRVDARGPTDSSGRGYDRTAVVLSVGGIRQTVSWIAESRRGAGGHTGDRGRPVGLGRGSDFRAGVWRRRRLAVAGGARFGPGTNPRDRCLVSGCRALARRMARERRGGPRAADARGPGLRRHRAGAGAGPGPVCAARAVRAHPRRRRHGGGVRQAARARCALGIGGFARGRRQPA